ncbi:MAG: hypothetical protein Q8P67_16610 [archaeon]|nr:hypothetical protein [archaeon]
MTHSLDEKQVTLVMLEAASTREVHIEVQRRRKTVGRSQANWRPYIAIVMQ